MYEAQTFDNIMQRMLARISDDMDKREGSLIWDALAPEAIEISTIYMELDSLLNIVFASTTYGKYLDYISASHGIERKEAQKSIGHVQVKGTPNTAIEKPVIITLIIDNQNLKFTVVDENRLPVDFFIPQSGECEVILECNTSGIEGNIVANSIQGLNYIQGVDQIINSSDFNSGSVAETDASLLERLLERVKNPPSSGNKADYKRWAKEISQVKYVNVKSLWAGNGTVKVIIAGEGGSILDDTVVKNVKEYLDPEEYEGQGEGKAPIGAKVTVVTVVLKQVVITIKGLSVKTNYDIATVKSDININLKNSTGTIAPGGKLILKACESIIMQTDGVLDFTEILINDSAENITTNDEEKIVLQEVQYE